MQINLLRLETISIKSWGFIEQNNIKFVCVQFPNFSQYKVSNRKSIVATKLPDIFSGFEMNDSLGNIPKQNQNYHKNIPEQHNFVGCHGIAVVMVS